MKDQLFNAIAAAVISGLLIAAYILLGQPEILAT